MPTAVESEGVAEGVLVDDVKGELPLDSAPLPDTDSDTLSDTLSDTDSAFDFDMSLEELATYEAEEEHIASVLEDLENHVNDSEAIYSPDEFEKPSVNYVTSDDLLNFSQFDDEVIEVSKDGERRVMIYSIGNKVNRRFFDDDYRLEKSEFWEIAAFDTSKIIKTEFFSYKNGEKKPYLKAVDYEQKYEAFYYAKNGLVEKSEAYKKVEGKNYITEICRWSYDGEKRITQIKTRTFSYNSEEDIKRRSVFVKTFLYSYNPDSEDGKEIPPDVKYYENDVLKSYEKYSLTLGSYTKHYYFDDGISIKTWYVDDKKVREAVYQNDRLLRVNKIREKNDEPKNNIEH